MKEFKKKTLRNWSHLLHL